MQMQETFLETKLKQVITDWQQKFFDDYVQPTM